MLKRNNNYYNHLFAVVALLPFFFGGYYTFAVCATGIVLAVGLLIKICCDKCISISRSPAAITLLVICVMYFVTRFWAVDKSMATVGFAKYLALLLFGLSICQLDDDDKHDLLGAVPISATAMTVLSFVLGFVPHFRQRVFDDHGDMHGTFEYANAFAIFLLLALVIVLYQHKNIFVTIALTAVLSYGIYMSNSRAVWVISIVVLFALAAVAIFKGLEGKKYRKVIIIAAAALLVAVIVLALATGYAAKIYNYITTDGSFVDRYLYYKDALKYALKHPFGKGAYAFYFAQGGFQSAFYYAIDVHNDYIQLMVEIGIIPALMFTALVVYSLFNKKIPLLNRILLFTLALHCLVDYDLQFMSLFFIMLLLLDFSSVKEYAVNGKLIAGIILSAVIVFEAVIGLSTYNNYIGNHNKSVYYHKNTPSLIILMAGTNQQQKGYDYAQEILDINSAVYEPNDVLARIYAENDRYEEALEQMEIVLKKDPRTMSHYQDYIDICDKAYEYYKEVDINKAKHYQEGIIAVPDRIDDLKANTDERAILYGRKQKFKLDKEHLGTIEKYKSY